MTIIEALVKLRNDLKLWVANNLRVKLDKNLGAEESGKYLTIDADGEIVTATPRASQDDLNKLDEKVTNNYVTKTEFGEQVGESTVADQINAAISNDELITTDDIDTICGATTT